MPNFITHILASLEYAFAIITLLGGVIAIHEFGHFIFAKWCGIRVDTFSIGFGPKLFSKKRGETEYVLSLVPLGGFVKIYGQDPEELAKDPNPQPTRAFSEKGLLQKISVLAGGPVFNYFLAVFIFSLLAMAGVQKLPALATRVVYGTAAYQAGLRSGDVIKTVNEKSMHDFEAIDHEIAISADKQIPFNVERDGKALSFRLPIHRQSLADAGGDSSQAGQLDGLEPFGREAVFAVSGANQAWGIQNGDKLLRFNGAEISSWEDLEAVVEANLNSLPSKIPFTVERANQKLDLLSPDISTMVKTPDWNAARFLEANELFNGELFVGEVVKGSPADKAGIKKGDHLLAVNSIRIYSFESLRSTIQTSGESAAKAAKNLDNAVVLNIVRDGKLQNINSGVSATKNKDPLGQSFMAYTIGIVSAGKAQLPKSVFLERTFNPFKALYIGVGEAAKHTAQTVVGLKKLATGEASMKSMGGPIMIGKLAGETLSSRGWREFLQIMAIISISLGVFNLLPVPVLDGGYIILAIVESIRGRPISQNITQAFLKVGLSLILILMVFAFYNDITRVLF